MNRAQIRGRVRRYINERTAGFWTDADLNEDLDDAMKDVNLYIANLDEEYFSVSATWSTEANADTYDLPTDFVFMERLEHATDEHQEITKAPFPRVEVGGDWPFPANGFPYRYIILGRTIKLIPEPDAIYPLRIFYSRRQDKFIDDNSVPTTPDEYHDLIAIKGALRSLTKKPDGDRFLMLTKLETEGLGLLQQTILGRKSQEQEHVQGYLEETF